MSLLDDVSIVVTPNGYKAGTLYGVLPVPTEGSELVTNGEFATDSDWTKGTGWTISGGKANKASGVVSYVQQNLVLTANKRYKVVFEVSNYTSGNVKFGFTTTTGSPFGTSRTANGTYTEFFTHDSNTIVLRFRASDDFVGSIDNISVIEVTNSDMDVTRATAATRVDENGLVNYAEVLGSERVTNGDFATTSNWSENGGANAWSISGGKANCVAFASLRFFEQTNALATSGAGKTYKVVFTISNYSQGILRINVGGYAVGAAVTSNGTHTQYIAVTNSSSNKSVYFQSNANTILSVDNISVKEETRNNVPRIDYTGGGCPHILAEPQRTNIFIQNDISTWSGFGSYAGNTTAPDGTTINFVNMEDIRIFPSTTISNSTEYTSSIYLKGNKTADVKLRNASESDTVITLSTEWQRFELTTTSISTLTNALLIDARFSQGMGATGLEVAIYGGQIEAGAYPTSYIPTSGSAVTRNADIFQRDGISSLINSAEGVLFAEIAALVEVDTARRFITLNDGGASNNVVLRYEATGVITARYQVGGVAQCSIAFATTITNSHKIAFKYKVNDFALWIDGTEVGTDTSGSVLGADTINKISFDSGNGTFPFYGKVKQLQVYDTALTDSELATLTT